jgi:hypothetical protein
MHQALFIGLQKGFFLLHIFFQVRLQDLIILSLEVAQKGRNLEGKTLEVFSILVREFFLFQVFKDPLFSFLQIVL